MVRVSDLSISTAWHNFEKIVFDSWTDRLSKDYKVSKFGVLRDKRLLEEGGVYHYEGLGHAIEFESEEVLTMFLLKFS